MIGTEYIKNYVLGTEFGLLPPRAFLFKIKIPAIYLTRDENEF